MHLRTFVYFINMMNTLLNFGAKKNGRLHCLRRRRRRNVIRMEHLAFILSIFSVRRRAALLKPHR